MILLPGLGYTTNVQDLERLLWIPPCSQRDICFAGASMADCSTTAAATDSMLGVRIGGAIGIFLVSSMGVFLPPDQLHAASQA